jgi:hypothetical protein
MREQKVLMKPSPYPPNTTEELDAIAVFEGLLDKRFVIPHLNKLDKVPNTDGHVEIVDEERRPIGKLEVQVRKIPDDSTSYSCPIELVAYSATISLPFLLVCVDVGNRRAYFRHLDPFMPELKQSQGTFTLKFDSKVQVISNEAQYLSQWIRIVRDYNTRIADYPRLRDIETSHNVSHISKQDRIYFQEFIDQVNRLLDSDFPIVKERFFKGIWKLGVGVSSADPIQVAFQLYAIAPGEPAILVSGIATPPPKPSFIPDRPDVVSWWAQGPGSNQGTVQYNWRARSALQSAKEEAEDFVLSYLAKMVRGKSLHLSGKRLCAEYLFWFVDRFGQSIGISPADRLRISELRYGIHAYLPAWGSLAVPRYLGELIRLNREGMSQLSPHMIIAPPFEFVAGASPETLRTTKAEVMRLIDSGHTLAPTRVSFSEVCPQSLIDAVDYLTTAGEEWVERPYKPRTKLPRRSWSGYTSDALRHNIQSILIGSAAEYREFIERNHIPLDNSPWLHQPNAMVYIADFRVLETEGDSSHPPAMNVYIVRDEDNSLPKVSVIDLSSTPTGLVVEKGRIKVGAFERDIENHYLSYPTGLFNNRPMLDRVYEMLIGDLHGQFKFRFS